MPGRDSDSPGLQYVGSAGVTHLCVEAIERYLGYGTVVEACFILTCDQRHALMLRLDSHEVVIVKAGFTSGYAGTGPSGFSYVLALLNVHGADIGEVEVNNELFARANACKLTSADLASLESMIIISPSRWYDYIQERDLQAARSGNLWNAFEPTMPFAIIDSRIMDLARDFWKEPDHHLVSAYRRLEDAIRKRTGLEEHGSVLFSDVFLGKTPLLVWPNVTSREQVARGKLFQATFETFRNPRGHRELDQSRSEVLAEFLAVNGLFRLEAIAQSARPASPAQKA